MLAEPDEADPQSDTPDEPLEAIEVAFRDGTKANIVMSYFAGKNDTVGKQEDTQTGAGNNGGCAAARRDSRTDTPSLDTDPRG